MRFESFQHIKKTKDTKNKENLIDDYFLESYKKEVLPIIEIIKPEEISLSEYQNQISKDLFESVQKIRTAKGLLPVNPEESVKEAKEILMFRLKTALKDARDYNRKTKPNEEFVKKAKIALLFEGDMTDANNSSYLKNENLPSLVELRDYIFSHNSYNRNGNKFTESDINSIMKTRFAKSLFKCDQMYYIGDYGTMKTIPESLMIGLSQAEEDKNSRDQYYWAIKNGLEVADEEKYSNKCLEQLLASGHEKLCLENFKKFKGKPIEKILKSGFLSESSFVQYLENLRLPENEFCNYLDIAVKNNASPETCFRFKKYNDFKEKIFKINYDYDVNNNKEEISSSIDYFVKTGYAGFILDSSVNKKYIEHYLNKNYDDFLAHIKQYNQEHLAFEYLKDEDKIKYAEKLIDQGEEFKIANLRKLFKKHSLGLDIFNKINKKNLAPSLKGELSAFKNLTEKEAFEFIDRERGDVFVDNINSFNFSKEFLHNHKVQEACLLELEKEISLLNPHKARLVNEKIPLPKEKVEKILLEAIKSKWHNNNYAVRDIIYNFPEIKKYLENPEDKKKSSEEFVKNIESNYMRGVVEVLECLPLDEELVKSEDIQKKCLGIIKKNIPRASNSNFDELVVNFFELTKRLSKFIDLPEYFWQQKEKIDIINSSQEDNIRITRRELIMKIMQSENPVEEYNKILKLFDETKSFDYINLDRNFLIKYIEEFGEKKENEENQKEKQKFVLFAEIVSRNRMEHLVFNNWDYFYKKLINLSDEQTVLFRDAVSLLSSPYNKILSSVETIKMFEILDSYSPEQVEKIKGLAGMKNIYSEPFDEKNYSKAVLSYINCTEDLDLFYKDDDLKNKVLESFDGEYKDIALKMFNKEWQDFLISNSNFLPPNIYAISKVIDDAGGAGNLKHFESLGNLIHSINSVMESQKTVQRTKEEIKKIFLEQEVKFDKNKISQDDRSEFYNLSNDIIKAAPSLYSSFLPIFESMSPKDLKTFIREIFPLYQAQLVILQKMENDDVKYDSRDLLEIRKSLKVFGEKIKTSKDDFSSIFASEKERLVNVLKEGFNDKFGLTKVPAEISKDGLRSIQNCIRYVGNVSNRNIEKETIISLYLGLEINNQWQNFRQGENINIDEYFSDEKLKIIKPLLEERKKSYKELSKIINIPEKQMTQFQRVLQEDTISNMIGNIQTVDIKLENIKNNILELTDPDIYENQKDKEIIELLTQEGKTVGSVLAKTYGEISGKDIFINENEKEILKKLALIFGVDAWNADNIKKIQDYLQPFGLVSNMINKIKEEKVDENIGDLKRKLNPTSRIVEIFNRLGEEFKQGSGAIALSKDITYLENLVIKDDKKISPEEKLEINNYLNSIKSKMKELELVLDKIKEYFVKIKKSAHLETNVLLKNRLLDIEKIIYSSDSSGMIVSHMTKDLNLVIENMRQCLGCMRKEANNDTNLSFGDYNKFFMINQGEKNKGSISDEIVFFLPAKISGDKEEMTFVFDRVYGSKSSDVLISNIMSVYKKYLALKKINPESNISLSVTKEAMFSVGLDSEILKKRLGELLKDNVKISQFEGLIDIPKSVFSDNYIEFGSGGARDSGSRSFSGINIK